MTEPGTLLTRIWHPDDFKGDPYESRRQLFATMEVGDEVLMWADTYNLYASIRSSAYGYANSKHQKHKKFHTERLKPPLDRNVIRVWRES